MTKKEQAQQKREYIQRSISACMHILHDSYLPNTDLWPTHLLAGWMIQEEDTIMVGARIDERSNDLVLNNHTSSYDKTEEQLEALKNILDKAVYDGVFIEFVGNTFYGPGNSARSNPGQSRFKFTIQD